MNRPKRQSILCVGVPGSGKTALTVRITDAMLPKPGYDSIFVLDRNEEWSSSLDGLEDDLEAQLEALEEDEARVRTRGAIARRLDGPLIASADHYHEYCALLAEERKSDLKQLVPRRVIWRLGPKPEQYGPALFEAVEQGHVVIVFCEAPDWFTSYERDWVFDNIPGRDDVSLSQLYSQGRAHIRNRHREPCKIHLITDTQDLSMVHWKIRKFSRTVLCSKVEGLDTFRMITAEFGDGTDHLQKAVRKLEVRKWIAIRGKMPALSPHTRGGRK